jgi:hypothetical protein
MARRVNAFSPACVLSSPHTEYSRAAAIYTIANAYNFNKLSNWPWHNIGVGGLHRRCSIFSLSLSTTHLIFLSSWNVIPNGQWQKRPQRLYLSCWFLQLLTVITKQPLSLLCLESSATRPQVFPYLSLSARAACNFLCSRGYDPDSFSCAPANHLFTWN